MTVAGFDTWARVIDEPLLLIDGRGVVVALNRGAARLLRLPRRPDVPLADLVAEPASEIAERLARWRRTGDALPAHLTFVGFDDGPRRIEVRVAALGPDGGGDGHVVVRAVAASGVARFASLSRAVERLEREVAEHRRTAQLLRESRSTMQAIVDLSAASVFAKDLEGRYLVMNPTGAALGNRTTDEFVGRTDLELYPPAAAARFRAHDREVLERGEPVTVEMPVDTPDGVRIFHSTVVPLVDADRHTYGVAGIATDISERVVADELLRERTAELLEVQRIARIGGWSWVPSTGEMDISSELSVILGREADTTWTAEDLVSITHPDDLPAASRALIAARDGDEVDQRIRVRRPDGTTAHLQLRVPTATGEGRPHRVVGTVQDVTERADAERRRLELEAQLRQSQRLESVGQLAGGVAHDFNNLLAVIGIQADLARRSIAPGTAADEHLRNQQHAIERAGALTRQLLVFSRQGQPERRAVDVNALVTDLAQLLQRSIGEHIELLTELTAEGTIVEADPSQLEQVLVNLAVNARDAMPDGGTLVVSTAVVPAEGAAAPATTAIGATDSLVRLTVTDTGTGMAADVADRAFEPFFSTKQPGVGTGLGLATVHGIVLQAGGDIRIDSKPGRGTQVVIHLPRAVPAGDTDATGPIAAPATTAGTGETVLVVEDLAPLGDLVVTLLTRAGYRALVATDGPGAIELAEREPIDLLLTDVMMPKMSGRELADRVRELHTDLPVLFMSGYTDGLVGHGDDDGTRDELLTKPFATADLLAAVRRALDG